MGIEVVKLWELQETTAGRADVTSDMVLQALRQTQFPRNLSRKSVMPEGTSFIEAFCLGLVGSRWPQVSDHTTEAEPLTRLLNAFLRGPHGPPDGQDFPFTSIQVNKNYASKRHVDANNTGDSYIIGLGDYSGGALRVDGAGELDVRHSWHKFDGNVPHCTTAVGGAGERYSLIYFSNSSLVHAAEEEVVKLRRLDFNVSSMALVGGLEAERDVLRRIRAADSGEARCLVVHRLADVLGDKAQTLSTLDWHRCVRLFFRSHTSTAQIAWFGLCHDDKGTPLNRAFVIVRNLNVLPSVGNALQKASGYRLQVQSFTEWSQSLDNIDA